MFWLHMATIGLTVVTILLTLFALRTGSIAGKLTVAVAWTAYAVTTAAFAGVL